jgi:cytidylate kinase
MAVNRDHARTDLNKVVDRQMRNWELARAQRVGPPSGTPPPVVREFVAISRTTASGGSEVAALLAERLQWPVFDRGILQTMAGDDQVRARLYEHMDEHDHSWLQDALGWILQGELRTDDYFRRLTETVLALARHGNAVFLGRGVDLVLPKDHGLRVRITAPLDQRTREFALQNNIPESAAQAEVERIDEQREHFRRYHFGATANDVIRHDLVLNLGRFSHAQAVEVIEAALRLRGIIG